MTDSKDTALPSGRAATPSGPSQQAVSGVAGIPSAELVAELVAALLDSQGLLEIANSVADELTLVAHTTGISSDAAAVLRDYDGMFYATRVANQQAIAKATGGAA